MLHNRDSRVTNPPAAIGSSSVIGRCAVEADRRLTPNTTNTTTHTRHTTPPMIMPTSSPIGTPLVASLDTTAPAESNAGVCCVVLNTTALRRASVAIKHSSTERTRLIKRDSSQAKRTVARHETIVSESTRLLDDDSRVRSVDARSHKSTVAANHAHVRVCDQTLLSNEFIESLQSSSPTSPATKSDNSIFVTSIGIPKSNSSGWLLLVAASPDLRSAAHERQHNARHTQTAHVDNTVPQCPLLSRTSMPSGTLKVAFGAIVTLPVGAGNMICVKSVSTTISTTCARELLLITYRNLTRTGHNCRQRTQCQCTTRCWNRRRRARRHTPRTSRVSAQPSNGSMTLKSHTLDNARNQHVKCSLHRQTSSPCSSPYSVLDRHRPATSTALPSTLLSSQQQTSAARSSICQSQKARVSSVQPRSSSVAAALLHYPLMIESSVVDLETQELLADLPLPPS
jgi:hypothetical protein